MHNNTTKDLYPNTLTNQYSIPTVRNNADSWIIRLVLAVHCNARKFNTYFFICRNRASPTRPGEGVSVVYGAFATVILMYATKDATGREEKEDIVIRRSALEVSCLAVSGFVLIIKKLLVQYVNYIHVFCLNEVYLNH